MKAKKYTTDHESIKFDDSNGVGAITITNYAQQSLGDVVFVELPSVGTKVAAGGSSTANVKGTPKASFLDQIGAVESVKAASDIVEYYISYFTSNLLSPCAVLSCLRDGRRSE